MVNKSVFLVVSLFLLVLPFVSGECAYNFDGGYHIVYDFIEPDGLGAECNLSLYVNNGTVSENLTMNVSSSFYSINFSNLSVDTYGAAIVCQKDNITYLSDCVFEVGEGDDMIPSALIFLPMLLSLIIIIGAVMMNEEHAVFKIFLFLLSIVPFFASMNFGLLAVIRYFDWPELQELIGTTVWWFGLMFVVIVSYFIIYVMYVLFTSMAQKKLERLKY